MTDEVWKSIPSLPEYEASSWGRIMRCPYQAPTPNGGMRTYGGQPHYGVWAKREKRFFFNFKGKNYKIARLVCEAFYGPPSDELAVCMHVDENSRNNRHENLKWGNQKENLNFPNFKIYCSKGMRARRIAIPSEVIAIVKKRILDGATNVSIVDEFGISPAHVSAIKHERSRKDVDAKP